MPAAQSGHTFSLNAVMIDAFATTFPGAPIKGVAEAVIGKNWMEAKA